jgi:hypothetical protein
VNAKIYSNFEGHINSGHDLELTKKKNIYFYTNEEIDIEKIQNKLIEIKQRQKVLEHSTYMNTKVRGANVFYEDTEKINKKAKKRIGKDRRELLAFDSLIDGMEDIIENYEHYSREELRDKISTLSLFVAFTDTIEVEHVLKGTLRSLGNVLRWFPKIPIKTKSNEHASNLMDNGEFLTNEEINELVTNQKDISRLDPPSLTKKDSQFWRNLSCFKYFFI